KRHLRLLRGARLESQNGLRNWRSPSSDTSLLLAVWSDQHRPRYFALLVFLPIAYAYNYASQVDVLAPNVLALHRLRLAYWQDSAAEYVSCQHPESDHPYQLYRLRRRFELVITAV